jgi:hypothetical protein
MAAIKVLLFRDGNAAHDVLLSGTDDGTNFSLDKLVLPGAVTFDLPSRNAPCVSFRICNSTVRKSLKESSLHSKTLPSIDSCSGLRRAH